MPLVLFYMEGYGYSVYGFSFHTKPANVIIIIEQSVSFITDGSTGLIYSASGLELKYGDRKSLLLTWPGNNGRQPSLNLV